MDKGKITSLWLCVGWDFLRFCVGSGVKLGIF